MAYPPEILHGGHTTKRILSLRKRGVQEQFLHHLSVVEHIHIGHSKCDCNKRRMSLLPNKTNGRGEAVHLKSGLSCADIKYGCDQYI